jgi:hypothetical protein
MAGVSLAPGQRSPFFSPFRPFMCCRQLGCEKGPLRIVDLAQRTGPILSLNFGPRLFSRVVP